MSSELMQALNEIEKDRGIPKDALIDAIKSALNTAYKKNFGIAQSVNVHIDELSGEVKVFSQKKVVDEVSDERLEISIDEAGEYIRIAARKTWCNEITHPTLADCSPTAKKV